LIEQWINQVVLYDLSVTAARSRPLGDGRFEVTLTVNGADEELDIGLFDEKDEVIDLRKHALHAGANTVVVIASRKPATAAIDPYLLRIDRNRFDNVKSVP